MLPSRLQLCLPCLLRLLRCQPSLPGLGRRQLALLELHRDGWCGWAKLQKKAGVDGARQAAGQRRQQASVARPTLQSTPTSSTALPAHPPLAPPTITHLNPTATKPPPTPHTGQVSLWEDPIHAGTGVQAQVGSHIAPARDAAAQQQRRRVQAARRADHHGGLHHQAQRRRRAARQHQHPGDALAPLRAAACCYACCACCALAAVRLQEDAFRPGACSRQGCGSTGCLKGC